MQSKGLAGLAAMVTIAAQVAGCAVGPDFTRPDAPNVSGYTKGASPTRHASADVAGGDPQHLVRNMDIPGKWWTLFRSPALNRLIERSIKASPTVDAAIAALRQATENTRAQEGHFFPLIQGNYTAERQQVSQ